MKLIQLYERESGAVYVNKEKTLEVISSLIEKQFGIFSVVGNSCLLANAIFSIQSASGFSSNHICIGINNYNYADGTSGFGMTPIEILNLFNDNIIEINSKKYQFKVEIEYPSSTFDVKSLVKSGHPVCFIFNMKSFLADVAETDEFKIDNRISKKSFDDDWNDLSDSSKGYHALLIIGIDSSTDEFIVRETRNKYFENGYAKFPINAIEKNFHKYKTLAFIVNSFKEIK